MKLEKAIEMVKEVTSYVEEKIPNPLYWFNTDEREALRLVIEAAERDLKKFDERIEKLENKIKRLESLPIVYGPNTAYLPHKKEGGKE